MILDNNLVLSDSQAVTASAVGSNYLDQDIAKSLGSGEPMGVLFTVEVAADQTSGDEDYTFDVEYATNAAQSTGRQLVGRRVFESGTPAAPAQNADLLVAGFQFVIPVPPVSQAEAARYLGIRYTTAGTSPTVTMRAEIVPLTSVESAASVSYPSGYTIT
jgi:hypothetical protein